MTNQHAVEVFKKHKGISPKLVMIIAIVCAIAVIGLVITSQVAIGLNNQIIAKDKVIVARDATIAQLQAEIGGITS